MSVTAQVSKARGVGAARDGLTPTPRARRAPRNRMAALVMVAPSLILYGVFLVAPLVLILRYAFSDDSPGIVSVLVRPSVLRVLETTAEAALYATVICAVISVMYAYAMQLAGKVWRMALTAALLGSLLASLIVRTYAFMIVTGDSGPFDASSTWSMGPGDGSLLFSRPAVLIAMVHVTLPLSVLAVFSVMNRIPPHLLGAARTLGARPASAWLRVTVPLLAPGIAAGAALAFIQGVGMFVVPAFLGGTSDRVVGQLIDTNVALLGRITEAAILSILMILAVLVCLLVFRLLWPIETLFFADHEADGNPRTLSSAVRWVRQRGFLPREGLMGFGRASLGIERMLSFVPWVWVCRVVGVMTAAFLVLPYLVMVPAAFTQTGFITFPPEGFSLRWFGEVGRMDVAFRGAELGRRRTDRHHDRNDRRRSAGLDLAKAKLQPSLRGAVLMLGDAAHARPHRRPRPGGVPHVPISASSGSALLGVTHRLLGVPVVVTVLVSSLRHYDFNLDRAAAPWGPGRDRCSCGSRRR